MLRTPDASVYAMSSTGIAGCVRAVSNVWCRGLIVIMMLSCTIELAICHARPGPTYLPML
eukprot:3834793-Rhodomonas_salina.3